MWLDLLCTWFDAILYSCVLTDCGSDFKGHKRLVAFPCGGDQITNFDDGAASWGSSKSTTIKAYSTALYTYQRDILARHSPLLIV